MNSLDQNVEVGVELGISTARLSAKAIIAVMDWFLDKDDKKNHYQNLNNNKGKQGKQNVKDLFEKYSDEEILPLDDNLSKDEVQFLSDELKKMGVDFGVHKVEKDNFSVFFAGKDMETIEKGMENAIQKFSKREKITDKMKKMMSKFGKKAEEEVNQEIKKDGKNEIGKEKKQEKIKKNTKKQAFSKPTTAQLELAKRMGVSNFKEMNKIELSLALEKHGADKTFFNDDNYKEKNSSQKKDKKNSKKNSKNKKDLEFDINKMKKAYNENKKRKSKEKKKEKSKSKKKNRSL